MFTRSAITPPEVNGFGWNLGNSEYIVWSWPCMSIDGQGAQRRRKIAENLNCLSRAHERYRWQTDGRYELALRPAEMRMVRWMCNVKVKDRVPSINLRERLGIHDILILQQTGCDGMGMSCEKKTLIGWRNVWNMRWRAPDQEVDQRGHGKRLCKKIDKHVIWTRKMLWIVVDGRSW